MAMAPRAPASSIGRIHIEPGEGALQIRTGPKVAAPSHFKASIELKAPPMRVILWVRLDGGAAPVVEELALRPAPGSPLTSTTLRLVLLDPLIRAVVKKASRPVIERPDVAPGAFQVKGGDQRHAWVSVPPGADERVLQIASLYNQALSAGSHSPAADAAAAVRLSRAQVARYVRRARAVGLIPPVDQVITKGAAGPRPALDR